MPVRKRHEKPAFWKQVGIGENSDSSIALFHKAVPKA